MHTKQDRLVEYLRKEDVRQALLFCNARHIVEKLARTLRQEFDDVEYIHAGLEQRKRTSIFNKFKREKIRFLVATDVAGRGLDFSHISHVINWDFPGLEQYAHRTGRVGRMGKKGKAFTFVGKRDLDDLREVIRVKKINPLWIGQDPLTGSQQGSSRPSSGGSKNANRRPHSQNKQPYKKKPYARDSSKKHPHHAKSGTASRDAAKPTEKQRTDHPKSSVKRSGNVKPQEKKVHPKSSTPKKTHSVKSTAKKVSQPKIAHQKPVEKKAPKKKRNIFSLFSRMKKK